MLVWCKKCVANLLAARNDERVTLLSRFTRASRRAYQIWFRESRGQLMIDTRTAMRGKIVLTLSWSRRKNLLKIRDGWTLFKYIHGMITGVFGSDPASVVVHGAGGGSGMRNHPKCWTEGDVGEENWKAGVAALTAKGWIVKRKKFADVVAEGY